MMSSHFQNMEYALRIDYGVKIFVWLVSHIVPECVAMTRPTVVMIYRIFEKRTEGHTSKRNLLYEPTKCVLTGP